MYPAPGETLFPAANTALTDCIAELAPMMRLATEETEMFSVTANEFFNRNLYYHLDSSITMQDLESSLFVFPRETVRC